MLNGIDVSNWQRGINLSAVPADFVIMKATEGTYFVSNDCNRQYQQAKSAGKLLGVYHYADGGDVKAEADFFLKNVAGYIGEAILCLDWENQNNMSFGKNDKAWVKSWCDYVTSKTGVKPIVYCSASVLSRLTGIGDYGFWVAQYANNNPTGYQSTPWNEGKYACVIRQYSSCGTLSGYSGRLDLNKFYGDRNAWMSYVGKKNVAEKPKTVTLPTEKDGIYRMYNPNSGEHVFTTDLTEANSLMDAGWKYEGIAWHQTGSTKVYRMYANGSHVYLKANDEYAGLDIAGWKGEKVAFLASDKPGDGLYPVFRLYNKTGGHHMYTISENERDTLVKAGWKLEGIAFYEHK